MYTSRQHKQSDAETRKAAFAALHAQYAPVSLSLILELRGLYVKFGQAAASSPFVPGPYRAAFKTLQSDVPSESFDLVRRVVEEDLGPLESHFSSFSETATGAASIGQAHLARLRSTGEEVVVKVQYPDAVRLFSADVVCLRMLVRLANPEAVPAFAEFESQLRLELDYRQELEHLTAIREAVMPRYSHAVAVPAAHRRLCSERVLTMELLPGPKLEGEVRRRMEALGMKVDEGESTRDWLMRMEAQSKEVPEGGEGGARWAQWIARVAARMVGLDAVLWLADRLITMRSNGGRGGGGEDIGGRAGGGAQPIAAELRASLSTVVEVHGYEIFASGLFNADPHPGNLIAMEDGRVGLIDYGQCKHLAPAPRAAIAELIVRIADDAPDAEIAAALRRAGVRTEKNVDEFLAKTAKVMFDRVSLDIADPAWHRALHKIDKVTFYPPDLLMVHRVALILRGLAVAVRQNLSIAELWRPSAVEALAAAGTCDQRS